LKQPGDVGIETVKEPSPAEGEMLLRVKRVGLCGNAGELVFTQQADGLHVKLPAEAPGKYASVYRISFEGSGH
jgi:hypothetical protein